MASVELPTLNYRLSIPDDVIKDGKLSSAQFESIAYAGQAHDTFLPGDKVRRGFFIGDGTGVGKGAQIAGIMLDNWNKGRHKTAWVSENTGLRPSDERATPMRPARSMKHKPFAKRSHDYMRACPTPPLSNPGRSSR